MSWHYLQEQDPSSVPCCTGGEPYAPLKSKITHAEFFCNGKLTAAYLDSLCGTTSKPLTANLGVDGFQSCLGAGHVLTYPQPEKAQGLKESSQDSGQKWPESLAKYDRATSSWRTAPCSLFEDSVESLAIFPKWGTTRNGELWERTASDRLITANVFGAFRKSNQDKQQATTGNSSAPIAENGRTHSIMKCGTIAIGVAPETWLTPTANEDAAGTPKGKMQKMLGNHPMIRGTTPEEWKCGTLNPEWVEWLMGWPIGWTDLKPLATVRYQQWQRWHSRFCRGG